MEISTWKIQTPMLIIIFAAVKMYLYAFYASLRLVLQDIRKVLFQLLIRSQIFVDLCRWEDMK